MKMFRYIALLAILVGTASCLQTNIDTPVINRGGQIQVVGRVQSFSDRNVDTRAFKVGDEGNTASMCLAVFDASGKCKGKQFNESSNPTFTLDKDKLSNGDYIYIFANIANPSLGEKNTLDEFLALTSDVQGVDMPLYHNEQGGTNTRCFPMIGVMEINDVDKIESVIQIPLEALYAKVVVNILSKPDQKVEGIDYASFSLTKYEVHNVVEKVDFVGGTISAKGKNDGTHDATTVSTVVYTASNITSDFAQADKQASFYFYIPERFCRAKVAADDFTYYPFGMIANLDEDEARRLPQCYKPMLAGAEGTGKEENDIKATFVRFFGEYIDHQGHNWNVSYDIYVGNDNYSNFDIERNTQYNNYVTIKGISKSNDQTNTDSTISIDHRVNIERVNPVIINLRRETLLDSHFEVRPLRIRKNTDFKGADLTNAKVRVEVVYKDDADKKWVGIERSFGMDNAGNKASDQSAYLQASDLPDGRKNAAGKRKYFTTGLTTTTLAGNTHIDLPLTEADQTVWIYVDECTEVGDEVRSAIVSITYSDGNDNTVKDDFILNQRKLFPVTYNGHTYHIEYHEEYLHNYDAEDEYGQTDFEGMPWGLNGKQLSNTHNSFKINETNSSWTSFLTERDKELPKYDFYIEKHDGDIVDNAGVSARSRAGQEFTSEIYTKSNGGVKILTMADQAEGAVEYCYNRNKRNADGSVSAVEWYLPSTDEMEEIAEAGYGRFEEFQDKFYWTSQPAYIRNVFYFELKESQWLIGTKTTIYAFAVYDDNPDYARATKVIYRGNDDYGYAPSGLKDKPDNFSSIDDTDGYGNDCEHFDNKCFNEMYRWKKPKSGSYTYDNGWRNPDFGGDEEFKDTRDNKRYHVHLGHLLDMKQEGYMKRTEKARVRCVRKVN